MLLAEETIITWTDHSIAIEDGFWSVVIMLGLIYIVGKWLAKDD